MTFCKDCKFWGNPSGDEPEWSYCKHPKARSDLTGRPDGFGVVDGEPYNSGSFATGPFFFCRHSEPRSLEATIAPLDGPCRVVICPACQTQFQTAF